MANTLETIREPESKTMKAFPRRIPIVLQNLSSLSNAFVTLAPRRSEFYAMPSQDYNFVGGGEYMSLLAVHEYRHVVQFQRSLIGFNKLLYYVFGQEAAAGLSFVTAPPWFWEGDAVATETAFTPYGRGRQPNFDLVFRTNLMEGRNFSYNKQHLRSYKNFVPNHYVLGYHMISHMRKQTGRSEVWGDIAGRAWSFPLPFAFSLAMKKESGQGVVGVYHAMMTETKSRLQKELDQLTCTPFEVITPRTGSTYTDYLYPQVLDDGSIAALKSGLGDLEQVIVFEEGKAPRQKFITGPLNGSGMLSASGKKVVWNEYRFDPRWPVKNFSVVKAFDFGEKLQNQITEKSRYAGAAISPDGDKILTVETDTNYRTTLVVLDYYSGKILKRISNPAQAFYSMMRWAEGGRSIVAIKAMDNRKSIVKIDYQSLTEVELMPPSTENIGHPVLAGRYLLYNSPYSGIDNIYAIDMQTGNKFQVTSARYGSYNPCLSNDGKTLYYNNQGANGMDIVKVIFDPSAWKPIELTPTALSNTYSHLVQQEGHEHLLDSVQRKVYAPVRYRKLVHSLNPHSWGAYVNSSLTRVNIGLTSKDVLSTTQIKAGYDFDIQERTGAWKATASIQALYPILDVTASMGNRADNLGNAWFVEGTGSNADTVLRNVSVKWNEKSIEGGLRVPLNLTSGSCFQGLSIANYMGDIRVTDFSNSINGGGRVIPSGPSMLPYFLKSYNDGGDVLYNLFNVQYYTLLKRSTRDINSRWGMILDVTAQSTISGSDFDGKLIAFSSYFYLPGFLKHHSLWGYWNFQSSEIAYASSANGDWSSNYVFRNRIALPRGLSISRSEKMYSMSGNYTMPVWYPDLALGPVLNLKRIRANGFIDYCFADNPVFRNQFGPSNPDLVSSASYLSTGIEVKFDINVFRFMPELDLGFRYSYGIQPSASLFEFLIGTFNF